jgi:hypothetical protein
MNARTGVVFLAVLAVATLAQAQTKVSGTVECVKPAKEFSIPVEGESGHVYAINQGTCTWTKPMEIAGTRTKQDVVTSYEDVKGDTAHGRGDASLTLQNGDKFQVRLESKTLLKDGAPVSADGRWKIMGGTGAVKSVTGGGTYTCKGGPEGTMTCQVSGEYSAAK